MTRDALPLVGNILLIEFFERFAFYGTVFTFTTFTLQLLYASSAVANAIVNIVFIISPLSALGVSCLADGGWGRPHALALSAAVYATGLIALTISASPWLYADFPHGASAWAPVAFAVGVLLLGVGYGGVKTCTAPLLGEIVAWRQSANVLDVPAPHGSETPVDAASSSVENEAEPKPVSTLTTGVPICCGRECGCGCRCGRPPTGGQRCGGASIDAPEPAGPLGASVSMDVLTIRPATKGATPGGQTGSASTSSERVPGKTSKNGGCGGTCACGCLPIEAPLLAYDQRPAGAIDYAAVVTNEGGPGHDASGLAAAYCASGEASETDSCCVRLPCRRPCGLASMSVTTAFTLYFWVVNLGGLAGTLVSPLLRGVTGPRVIDASGDVVTTGYYMSFGVCSIGSTLAAALFVYRIHLFAILRSPRVHLPSLLRTAALMAMESCRRGCHKARGWRHAGSQGHAAMLEQRSAIVDKPVVGATFEERTTGPPAGGEQQVDGGLDADDIGQRRWSRHRQDIVSSLRAARLFAVLPVYWLIQNQCMSNVVVQAGATKIPSHFPPEIYNNISTISLLVMLPIVNKLMEVLALKLHRRRLRKEGSGTAAGQSNEVLTSPYRLRMSLGVLVAIVEIGYAAFLQTLIEDRGTFAGDGSFVPHLGREPLNGLLIIPIYVLNGTASALVDPTSLEAAFVFSPERTKSLVMSLYLLASSLAGFLGLAFTPLAVPSHFFVMFVVMAALLAANLVLWFRWLGPSFDRARG